MSAPSIEVAEVGKSTRQVEDLLRARYPDSAHALVFEVRDGAGFDAGRSCDALCIGTWPSRGLKLMGFEIKVSRSDWLKEYRDPSKADAFARFCDEWWVVAGSSKIVQPDELPESWGLLVAQGAGLKCVKPAPKLNPIAIDRSFLAAFVKKAKQQSPSKALLDKAVEAARQDVLNRWNSEKANAESAHQSLLAKVQAFEQASGIRINGRWDYNSGEKIGEAVRIVLNGQNKPHEHQLRYLLKSAEQLVITLREMNGKVDEPASLNPSESLAVLSDRRDKP